MSVYTISEVEYPSVTTILDLKDKSKALMYWQKNTIKDWLTLNIQSLDNNNLESIKKFIKDAIDSPYNISEEAKGTGTIVHDLIEKYIKEGSIVVGKSNHEVDNSFSAFRNWERENINKWLESEKKIYSKQYCYAGMMDALAEMKDGKIYLIDFKTSKGFYDGYDEQISAYRYARTNLRDVKVKFVHDKKDQIFEKVEDFTNVNIDGMGILRLDKLTGMPEWKDYSDKYDRALKAFLTLTDYYYLSKNRRLKNNPIANNLKAKNQKKLGV